MRWIFLSKHGQDEYMARLAHGAGCAVTAQEGWSYDQDPDKGIVLRGIMKHKIMKQCWQDGRPFRYVDSGYVGNRPGPLNPGGWKWWHRIVPNDLQHETIIARPADRWQKLKTQLVPRRTGGRDILIVVPDEKACTFYDTTPQIWLAEIKNRLAELTDRPIIIRERTADPTVRTRDRTTSFAAALSGSVHATITFNSVAATESIMAGVPVFVTAAANAARPVANTDLAVINEPWFPDRDLVHDWACHLAYGQFHIDEMADGTAQRILDETPV